MDVRKLVPRKSEYMAAEDIEGRGDVVVTIERAERKTAELNQGGKMVKQEAGILYFKGAKRGLVLNKTNSRRIAQLHGWDTDEWVGKQVTLYVDKTRLGRDVVPCIRVRTNPPAARNPEDV
jgi:hypothetical protein